MIEQIIKFFLILGIVTVAIILIMLAHGWRPDVEEEKKALKKSGDPLVRIICVGEFVLLVFVLRWMGMNKKTAVLVAFCLVMFEVGALWLWSYKQMKKQIKKMNNELICSMKDTQKE